MAIVVVVIGVDMSMSLFSAIASIAGTVIEEISAISLMTLILVHHAIHLTKRSLIQKFCKRQTRPRYVLLIPRLVRRYRFRSR